MGVLECSVYVCVQYVCGVYRGVGMLECRLYVCVQCACKVVDSHSKAYY